MSHTKRISRKTRSIPMKRADSRQVVIPGSREPAEALKPSPEPEQHGLDRAHRVREAKALVNDAGFDLDKAFQTAMGRMIKAELDNRH